MSLSKENFLKYQDQFKLGELTTESLHPGTLELSKLVNEDISKAITCLKKVDANALKILNGKVRETFKLHLKIKEVIDRGDKVYLSGCGATGRLAISLEYLYREKFGDESNSVTGFMAGGDYALIRSVESFEDSVDYGKKQLLELGFGESDLLIGITEGGETSFVIGSVEYAAEKSKEKPFFVYCNPDDELLGIERSERIIKNKLVNKLNLTVGPMALSGSTRMQATTVQMFAIGHALLESKSTYLDFKKSFLENSKFLSDLSLEFLSEFIKKEADQYKNEGLITYEVSSNIGICILTDTTERSPTFSLYGFENTEEENLSLCYLTVEGETDNHKAWMSLLRREPRCLHWKDVERDISLETLYQFNISNNSKERRSLRASNAVFKIVLRGEKILFDLDGIVHEIQTEKRSLFMTHLQLKLIMNIHSTLVMGLLNRFEGNMMTFVRPSNFKLIDRAKRYIMVLLESSGVKVCESEVIDLIFQNLNSGSASIVKAIIKKLSP